MHICMPSEAETILTENFVSSDNGRTSEPSTPRQQRRNRRRVGRAVYDGSIERRGRGVLQTCTKPEQDNGLPTYDMLLL